MIIIDNTTSSQVDFFKKIKDEAQMQFDEVNFIINLIKKYNAKKILEIGVAAGTTSAAILNEIKDVDSAKLYSCDLAKKHRKNIDIFSKIKNYRTFGTICHAGEKGCAVRTDGTVTRCYQNNFNLNVLGNVKNKVIFHKKAMPCLAQNCNCNCFSPLMEKGRRNIFSALYYKYILKGRK